MADKRIQDLTPASSIQTNDLFVLEQSGAAKSLTGQILINDLAAYLDGHGGISDIVYTPPVAPSLDGTLTITMADETVYSVTVKNGNGITSIVVSYGISNNGTDPTTVQSWGSTVTPPTNQHPYEWTRIRLNQTTGVYTDAYSVTVKANDPTVYVGTVSAQPGLNASASITNTGTANDPVLNFSFELPQGEKGDTGDYIVPVVSYGTSTAAATEPSTWYNDPSSVSYAAGNFIWRKTEFTLHDAQTVQDTKTEIIGYIGQNGSGSGTVQQITFNGTVYSDDGTGNVTMTLDAADVGAIEDPSTKSNGQVLTYDSSAGKWVAANPSTGNVNTVNNKGVDAGTTNVTVYASDIKMSSSDSTTIPNAMPKPQTSGTPADLGTAAIGSATTYAKSDHVHSNKILDAAAPADNSTVADCLVYAQSNPKKVFVWAKYAATSYTPGGAAGSWVYTLYTTYTLDQYYTIFEASNTGTGELYRAKSNGTWVKVAPDAATATPANLGTAAVGSSSDYARADHVHNMPSASDVGAMSKWALLWTNASPSSSFAAQTVQLDLSGYDMVGVFGYNDVNDGGIMAFAPVGESGALFFMYNYRQRRYFAVSSAGVQFGNGYSGAQNNSLTVSNTAAIPYYIYGIKGIS